MVCIISIIPIKLVMDDMHIYDICICKNILKRARDYLYCVYVRTGLNTLWKARSYVYLSAYLQIYFRVYVQMFSSASDNYNKYCTWLIIIIIVMNNFYDDIFRYHIIYIYIYIWFIKITVLYIRLYMCMYKILYMVEKKIIIKFNFISVA